MSKYKSRAKHVKRTILGNGNHMVETAHDLYDLPRIFLLRPSVIHHQTRHAGCCRQLNTLYGISRLFHICHMLNVNLLSAVKRIGYQWWVCQFWCSLTNANETAQCWAVSTGPTTGCWALMPPVWSLFLTVYSETCLPVVCWRSFWRALAALLLNTKQISVLLLGCCPSTAFYNCVGKHTKPPCDSTYGCVILEELDYLCNLIGL